MKHKLLLLTTAIFFLTLVSLSTISATETLGYFQKNTSISLLQSGGNESTSFTYCNISSVKWPNSTNILTGLEMSSLNGEFNYTLPYNYTNTLGRHIVTGYCGTSADITHWSYDFYINALGQESTESTAFAANRGVYLLLVIGVVLILGFFFTEKFIFKWTFFLFGLFFFVMAINIVSISIYNEIGNTSIGAVFDQLGAITYTLYYFIFGILVLMWVLTTLATLADRKRMKQAQDVGSVNIPGGP